MFSVCRSLHHVLWAPELGKKNSTFPLTPGGLTKNPRKTAGKAQKWLLELQKHILASFWRFAVVLSTWIAVQGGFSEIAQPHWWMHYCVLTSMHTCKKDAKWPENVLKPRNLVLCRKLEHFELLIAHFWKLSIFVNSATCSYSIFRTRFLFLDVTSWKPRLSAFK